MYPVKINGTNCSAVLDAYSSLVLGAVEALGQGNKVIIARINWLTDKINGKTYSLIVMYTIKEQSKAAPRRKILSP